jgi:copper(I)-binding protein
MFKHVAFASSLALLLLVACGQPAARIAVEDAWARPALATATSPADMGGNTSSMMASTATPAQSMNAGMGGDMSGETMPMGGRSAAYMTLVNTGNAADRLIRATSDVAATVELHTVIMENEVAQMRPVEAIEVPANGRTELKPGGYHVMLMDLTRDLQVGDTVRLTLTFERAGDVQLDVPVREP